MKTRIARKLTAGLAALAVAASGVIANGASHAHAFTGVTYSITANTYIQHTTPNTATVQWGTGSDGYATGLTFTITWGDGATSSHPCFAFCKSGNFSAQHTYNRAGTYSVCVNDNFQDGSVCVSVVEF